MRIWQAILLGAVQGLTEFLPVSSSGHLLLVERWLGVETGGLFFDAALHLGTLFPLIAVFRTGVAGLFKKPFKTLFYLAVASVPAAAVGFLLQDKIETVYKGGDVFSAVLLSVSLAFTAAELFFAEKFSENRKNALPLSFKSSIIIGMAQAFAVFPGVSRSGTVITGGTVARLDRNKNAEFAFLTAIPVILGAAASSGFRAISGGLRIDFLCVAAGVLSAAVTGYIAVGITLKAVKKSKFGYFSVYLIILAAVSLIIKVVFGV